MGRSLCSFQMGRCSKTAMENQAATREGLSLASPLCLGSKPALSCSCSHVESSLPLALLLVFVALQSAKGVFLPYLGLQDWGIQYVTQTTHSPGQLSSQLGTQGSRHFASHEFPILCDLRVLHWILSNWLATREERMRGRQLGRKEEM